MYSSSIELYALFLVQVWREPSSRELYALFLIRVHIECVQFSVHISLYIESLCGSFLFRFGGNPARQNYMHSFLLECIQSAYRSLCISLSMCTQRERYECIYQSAYRVHIESYVYSRAQNYMHELVCICQRTYTREHILENICQRTYAREHILENLYQRTYIREQTLENLYQRTCTREHIREKIYQRTYTKELHALKTVLCCTHVIYTQISPNLVDF